MRCVSHWPCTLWGIFPGDSISLGVPGAEEKPAGIQEFQTVLCVGQRQ